MADSFFRRTEEGGTKDRIGHRDGATIATEALMRSFAEKKDGSLSSVQQIKQLAEDCQATLKEYDQYYQGSESSGAQGLRQESLQIIRHAKYYKTLIDLKKNAKTFTEYYRECMKDLQGVLDRYPKQFRDFRKQQETLAQRADDVTRSIFNPAILYLRQPDIVNKPESYMQAGNFIPAVDTSLRSRKVIQVDAQEHESLWETYHSVRDYDGIFSSRDSRGFPVSHDGIAYACVFYKAYGNEFDKDVEALREQGRPSPRHMVERTQQELLERRCLIEQQLGFPAIPALLEQTGKLSEERCAPLAREYETIQKQGYTGDGFARLEKLVNTLLAEHSVYEITGKTTDRFTPPEDLKRQQKIVQQMQTFAKASGEKALTKKVTEVLMNELIDQPVRAEIADAFGTAASASWVESLREMAKNSQQRDVRAAATSGLFAIAEKNEQVNAEAMSDLSGIANDGEQHRGVREGAIRFLGRLGGAAMLELRAIAENEGEDVFIRNAAVSELGGIAKDEKQGRSIRRSAIGQLAHVGGVAAVSELSDIVLNEGENVFIRGEVIAIFEGNAEVRREAASILSGIAKDRGRRQNTRISAIEHLGHLEVEEAVSALRAIVENDNREAASILSDVAKDGKQHQSVRLDAIIHLEDVRGADAVPVLGEIARNDREAEVRSAATLALGGVARNRAQDRVVRIGAIGHLGHVGGAEAVSALGEIAEDEEEEEGVCGAALSGIGEIARNGKQHQDVRLDAIDHLGRVGGVETVSALSEIAENEGENAEVRGATTVALSRIAQYDREAEVRSAATLALGGIASNGAQGRSVRLDAIDHLGRVGGVETVSALSEIAENEGENAEVRGATTVALSEIARNDREAEVRSAATLALSALVGDGGARDRVVRLRVIGHLGYVGGAEAVSAFREIAENEGENTEVRGAATLALGEIAQDEGENTEVRSEATVVLRQRITILGGVAKDGERHPDERRRAMGYLGYMGGAEAVSALGAIAENERENVFIRSAAVSELGKIVQNKEQDRVVRIGAIEKIGNFGGAEAVLALREIAENEGEEEDVREAAIVALGGIARNEGEEEDVFAEG